MNALKYTLKNRPVSNRSHERLYQEWFEGFEKELREKLKKPDRMAYVFERLIKEILGE